MLNILMLGGLVFTAACTGQECIIKQDATTVALCAPDFVFRLDTANGLRAQEIENRLTGRHILLDGAELEADIGLPDNQVETLHFEVTKIIPEQNPDAGECILQLQADRPGISATVTYSWNNTEPVLHKRIKLNNEGPAEINRLLQVRLGSYSTNASLSGDGSQGFPVYADNELFLSLAHPAGWTTQEPGKIRLRHYPGIKLSAGEEFTCMETVIGVGKSAEARTAFLTHLKSRMRRMVRGHDKPYVIFEPFGGRTNGDFNETEEFVLDMIDKVAMGQHDSDCNFDLFSIDFWVDYKGTLKECDPERFPNGLTSILDALKKQNIEPGLWIDSSWEEWSIGGNPATHCAFNFDPTRGPVDVAWGRKSFCRATEPVRSMYTEAFCYHIRENNVRLLKFDNFADVCQNPNHDHLPGIYSTEPIMNAVIEFLKALDTESPDVFLMGYWGYRSPWWLLHLDTFFETGIPMEAASPGDRAASYARAGVTRKLDQGHVYARDIPWLGTDSLGVWLSHWPWNSQIGTERWQDGFVMDICRGNMLAQPWSDPDWLTPQERRQMGIFIALLKAHPECFGNARLILGDPWKEEAYGYCCTDGERAFLAINNFGWEDRTLTLELNETWGLPAARQWDLYRWYPAPARLTGPAEGWGDQVPIRMRPFEVMLLEVVSNGVKPALGHTFTEEQLSAQFSEASRAVSIEVTPPQATNQVIDPEIWQPVEILQATSAGGAILTVQPDGSLLASGSASDNDTYSITARTDITGISALLIEAIPDDSLPGKGPGRAVNGNFMLSGLHLTAGSESDSNQIPLKFRSALADFEQTNYGHWPASAAIDDDPETAWSIDPSEGETHVAIFELTEPFGQPGGLALTIEMNHGEREHALGRFRIWVTSEEKPQLPTGFGIKTWQVTGQVPQTRNGGLLVVSMELEQAGKPLEIPNLGSKLAITGTLDGQPVDFQPVLGELTYPASWQSWRLETGTEYTGKNFKITIQQNSFFNCKLIWSAHFIPDSKE